MTHFLKIYPAYFRDVKAGIKTFEIRKNDRSYKKDDILVLNEYDYDLCSYTGHFVVVKVVYFFDNPFFCKDDYVILGIKLLNKLIIKE